MNLCVGISSFFRIDFGLIHIAVLGGDKIRAPTCIVYGSIYTVDPIIQEVKGFLTLNAENLM